MVDLKPTYGVRHQAVRGASSFAEAFERQAWHIPDRYNIAADIVDRWADDPDRATDTALAVLQDDDRLEHTTWAEMKALSAQFGHSLVKLGIGPGQVVSVVLGQGLAAAVSHMATYRVGAVLCPISQLFSGDALAWRLRHSETRVLVTDRAAALRLMRQADVDLQHQLRCAMSGGELLSAELRSWCTTHLCHSINQGFGQTEVNDTLAVVTAWEEPPAGSLGRALPGHEPLVLDDEDKVVGRGDDVIKSSGYRIGPVELENVILQNSAVLECAVVGLPDEKRGQIITAVLRLRPGTDRTALFAELTDLTRGNVGKHAYPRHFEVVDEFPKTVTGKIRRAAIRQQFS